MKMFFAYAVGLEFLHLFLHLLMPMLIRAQQTALSHYQRTEILESDWSQDAVENDISSHISCAALASSRDHEYYIYDKPNKECQLGSLVNGGGGGSQTKVVMGVKNTPSIEKIVLAVGRYDTSTKTGDKVIDVIMPNGKVCPKTDHGIPDFDVSFPNAISRQRGGLVEVDGILYICGGIYMTPNTNSDPTQVKTTECHKLNLGDVGSGWVQIGSMIHEDPMTKFGLLAHDGALFAFHRNEFGIEMYNSSTNQWSVVANRRDRPGKVIAVVQDSNLAYMMGGLPENEDVEVYDMDSPNSNPTAYAKNMCYSVKEHSCALTTIKGGKGILCAGGVGMENRVQFLPLDGVSDCRVLTETFNGGTYEAALMGFPDRLIYYGGNNGSYVDVQEVYIFNEYWEKFELSTTVTAPAPDDFKRTYGYINGNLVAKECAKYL